MHAQQQIEIEHIRAVGYKGFPQKVLAAMPPAQQTMLQSWGIQAHIPATQAPAAAAVGCNESQV